MKSAWIGNRMQMDFNDWSNRLATGQAQGADIAFGFIFSDEFKNLNLCNEHYVDSMYASFFGREAGRSRKGRLGWTAEQRSYQRSCHDRIC